jgi:predicted GNAT family acetyltransferase
MPDQPAVIRTEKQFEIHVGDQVAFAEYRRKGDSVIFPHTVVPEALGGQGLGTRLIETGLAYAKEQGLLVRPHCSFFRAYLAKRPELHDMVHPDERAALTAA